MPKAMQHPPDEPPDKRKVNMRIQRFVVEKAIREHKGWNRPALNVGDVRWAIRYGSTPDGQHYGGFWTYNYATAEQAAAVLRNMQANETDTVGYWHFNCKRDIQDTIPVRAK